MRHLCGGAMHSSAFNHLCRSRLTSHASLLALHRLRCDPVYDESIVSTVAPALWTIPGFLGCFGQTVLVGRRRIETAVAHSQCSLLILTKRRSREALLSGPILCSAHLQLGALATKANSTSPTLSRFRLHAHATNL